MATWRKWQFSFLYMHALYTLADNESKFLNFNHLNTKFSRFFGHARRPAIDVTAVRDVCVNGENNRLPPLCLFLGLRWKWKMKKLYFFGSIYGIMPLCVRWCIFIRILTRASFYFFIFFYFLVFRPFPVHGSLPSNVSWINCFQF